MAFFRPQTPTAQKKPPTLRQQALSGLAMRTSRPTAAPGQASAQMGANINDPSTWGKNDDLSAIARQRAQGGTIQQPPGYYIPTAGVLRGQAANAARQTSDEDAAAPAAQAADPVDALARQRAKAMAAKAQQLKVEEQKQQQRLSAASGLGGFGLSGASASAANDLGSKQTRDRILALEDYRQSMDRGELMKSEQEWLQEQRELARKDLADAEDMNSNGIPDDSPDDKEARNEESRQEWLVTATRKGDGTIQNYNKRQLENMGFIFHSVNEWWGSYLVDQYGNKYEAIS